MVSRTAFAATIAATFCSPAASDELRPIKYKITVVEQVRHEIIVEADQECGRERLRYWKRVEPRDRPIQRGNRRRQLYWPTYTKPATLP